MTIADTAPPADEPAADKPRRSRWLRHELLLRLTLPLFVIFAAACVFVTVAAQRLTDEVFDRWLLDSARSLADQVRFEGDRAALELPNIAEAILAYDEVDRVWFSVEQQGRHILGHPGIPHTGTRNTSYRDARAFDSDFGDQPVRVVVVDALGPPGQGTSVSVAETIEKRRRAQQEVLGMLLPLSLLLLAAVVAIWFAVARTARSLEGLAARWNTRAQASIEPIPDDVPRELAPFAAALNDLLARVRAMLARERQFSANAAHQLRTALAGVRLGLARAADASDVARIRVVLGEVDRSAERSARLVQQLLALSRLDPEVRGSLVLVPTDLVGLVREVGGAFVDSARDLGIDIELRAPGSAVPIDAHAELLAEAIGNLLDNALRHTPPTGRIVITVREDPPTLQIEDSGAGVPADERQAVFERLVRGRQAVGEGSGLGLAIVRDIATLHRAEVVLGGSDLGGARVTIRFSAPG